jgi:hypothetical protein
VHALSTHQCSHDDQSAVHLIPLLALIGLAAWLCNIRRVTPSNFDHEHSLSAASAVVGILIDASEAEAARISARRRNRSSRPGSPAAHRAHSRRRQRAPRSEEGQVLEISQEIVPSAANSAGNELNPNQEDKGEGRRLKPTSPASDAGQSVSIIARPFGTAREYEKAKSRTPEQTCIAAPWWATFHIAHCMPVHRLAK